MFQFDNILYEKNYGEIEGVEKIKKTGESLKREIFFGEVHFMITKMKQNELWAILLLSGSSFNSEAPKNWEPLSLTWIYTVRTGASELKESVWAASDSQKMLHFKTCSSRLHSREQGVSMTLLVSFLKTFKDT